jgi:hypothetical protein
MKATRTHLLRLPRLEPVEKFSREHGMILL